MRSWSSHSKLLALLQRRGRLSLSCTSGKLPLGTIQSCVLPLSTFLVNRFQGRSPRSCRFLWRDTSPHHPHSLQSLRHAPPLHLFQWQCPLFSLRCGETIIRPRRSLSERASRNSGSEAERAVAGARICCCTAAVRDCAAFCSARPAQLNQHPSTNGMSPSLRYEHIRGSDEQVKYLTGVFHNAEMVEDFFNLLNGDDAVSKQVLYRAAGPPHGDRSKAETSRGSARSCSFCICRSCCCQYCALRARWSLCCKCVPRTRCCCWRTPVARSSCTGCY